AGRPPPPRPDPRAVPCRPRPRRRRDGYPRATGDARDAAPPLPVPVVVASSCAPPHFRPRPRERAQRIPSIPTIPAVDAVVPRQADPLRTRAEPRETEPQPAARPIEARGALDETRELPADRTVVHGALVPHEAKRPPAMGVDHVVGGEHAVFERERD